MSNQRVDSKGRMYKEDFVAFMGKLKDKKDKSDAYAKRLEEVFGEGVGLNFMEKTGVWWMLDYIVDLLVLMFGNDTEDILYWYIYESDWGASEDGSVMTFSDLYDILVGDKEPFYSETSYLFFGLQLPLSFVNIQPSRVIFEIETDSVG